MRYVTRVSIALSVLLNVVLGGASNQTFSARNWQWRRDGKRNGVWLIDRTLGQGHCVKCWTNWTVTKGRK